MFLKLRETRFGSNNSMLFIIQLGNLVPM
uniref:Uncharacterized protein n=1 Tax=Arundo donax TaxID=35708 RepID=A0A0A9CC43_ARUDO